MTSAHPRLLSDQDSRTLAALLDELSITAITGSLGRTTTEAIRHALGVSNEEALSNDLRRIASQLRSPTEPRN